MRRRVLLVLILLAGLYGLQAPIKHVLRGTPAGVVVDHDTTLLTNEVLRKPTFHDTGAWWTGTWCPEAHYFRPLTITGFWLEYRIFGPQGNIGFTLVHIVSHLILLAIAFLFLAELLGLAPAALATLIYATHWAGNLTLPTADEALTIWKDSCDVWCTTFYVAALWAYLLFLKRGGTKRLLLAIGLFLISIGFKEVGYMVPFMLLLLLWHQRQWKTHWWSAAPFFVLGAICWCYRLWALGGWGARTGANRSWMLRWANDAMGLRGGMVANDFLTLAIIGAFVALYLAYNRRYLIALGFAALTAVAVCATAWKLEMTVENTLWRLIVGEPWLRLPFAVATVWMYWRFLKNRWRDQVYAYLFIVIANMPLAVQPITSNHAYYFLALGWGIFLAYIVIDAWQLGAQYTPN